MSKKYDPKTVNLEPRVYPHQLQWAIDQDYLEKLSPDEREWLSKFLHEYYGSGVNKSRPDPLHNTDELRRDCYRRNYHMRNDAYSRGRVDYDAEDDVVEDFEDAIINILDRGKVPLKLVKPE